MAPQALRAIADPARPTEPSHLAIARAGLPLCFRGPPPHRYLLYVIVRDARANDMPAVAARYEWLFDPPGTRPPQWDERVAIARLHEAAASERSAVLVADVDSQIIGICVVYLDIVSVRFGQRCWVEDLAVDPDWRSQGVGARMMDAAEQWARERGATHLELDSGDGRVRAHGFYERRDPAWTSRCFGWKLT